MPEKVLEIKMLGGFSVSYGGVEIVIDRNTVSKTTQLMQVFSLYSEEGISKATLIEAIYGRGEVENQNGSLNNTLFRLRKQLKAAGLPDSNYINIRRGICTWDEAIPLKVDVCEFRKLVTTGRNCDDDRKLELFSKAASLYVGELLPNMIGEDWVSVENVSLRKMYFNCVRELCEELMEQDKYEEVLEISTRAAEIYPFEDWQLWQIDSLIALSRYTEAMEIYQKATKLVFDELGLSPSPEMLQRFKLMGEHITLTAEMSGDIKSRLDEKEKAEGAYYCTFPSFVDIYHIFSRMMERNGKSVYIMLITLRSGLAAANNGDRKDRTTSRLLFDVIRESLRKGDIYTRYSYTQYLIMFPEINLDNCKVVSDRIAKNFRRKVNKKYDLAFDSTSIAEIGPAEDGLEMRFLRNIKRWKK